MARQKDTFYFDGFRRSADYACQAAKLLSFDEFHCCSAS